MKFLLKNAIIVVFITTSLCTASCNMSYDDTEPAQKTFHAPQNHPWWGLLYMYTSHYFAEKALERSVIMVHDAINPSPLHIKDFINLGTMSLYSLLSIHFYHTSKNCFFQNKRTHNISISQKVGYTFAACWSLFNAARYATFSQQVFNDSSLLAAGYGFMAGIFAYTTYALGKKIVALYNAENTSETKTT